MSNRVAAATTQLAKSNKAFTTISFSGAGHLLPYHLGAAHRLVQAATPSPTQQDGTTKKTTTPTTLRLPPIRAIAGSSSGAIAAAVLSLIPHRLEEYTDRFIQNRGHALRNLTDMLSEEKGGITHSNNSNTNHYYTPSPPLLIVCTTRCHDGSMKLFHFQTTNTTDDESSPKNDPTRLLRAIQASCTIPPTFHPYDMISNAPLCYPNADAVEIDGVYYVDGGIAAPAPPTPFDGDPYVSRIVVSPLSANSTTAPPALAKEGEYGSIRPKDDSWSFWPWDIAIGGGGTGVSSFRVRPSVQNLLALVGSMGGMSSDGLRGWYDRGVEDAEDFLVLDGWGGMDGGGTSTSG